MSTIISPTNIPTGGRRPIPVSLPRRFPADVPAVFRRAARIIAANGFYQGDYFPDAFDREMDVPVALRPLSIVAALRCAVTGDPRRPSILADHAIAVLALRLNEGPAYGGIFDLEDHVDSWGDDPRRTVESVIAVLEQAADAVAVSL